MEEKRNKGITLVVLVVTIIILLILAGVAIVTLTQTELFDKSKQAKNLMENAQEEEKITLADYDNKINEIVGSSSRENNNQQPNKENTMSGEEHFIGEYYFNGKPIYEKTIYISSLSSVAGEKIYNHGINDADDLWFDSSKTFLKWKTLEGNPVAAFNYFRLNGDSSARIALYGLTNKSFAIEIATNRSSLCAYVTINYTKTTDQGNGTTIPSTSAN